ncbi:hypothetical protein JAO73_10510 [Hymenobacter sp. BT523]|uniref:hypothetical protein n=1 Tax=Hymenobacter sp. BT523 TaxID=2795725 RepID=UPI0018EACFDD|nr:hypothetical protein [Hymenobacter sp. BT523]MBJ6109447.1 hypothetical protein [Hymenobacter sp. BT523]
MADLTDLPGPSGADNQPGLKSTIYLAPEDWFAQIKGVKGTNAVGDSVTVDGSHTFKPGKGFIKAYGTLDSGMLKLDPVGERDGRGKKATFEFFNPGNTKAAAEFDRTVKNLTCIVLLQTADGVVQQVGTAGLGCEVLGSYDSGKLSGGRRGYTFKGESYQNGNLFYEGDIVLKDGSSIAALTGIITPANP